MALSENVKIGLKIEVAQSTTDVNALNKSLASLQSSLSNVNKESKTYSDIEAVLAKNTAALNKTTLDSAIANASNAKSIGELNKAMKALKAAQEDVDKTSPDFKRLAKAINDTEGRVGDLNDSFKTLTGTGVEKLNSSLGLLQQSLFAGDTDKLKIGLQGIGQAMSAIPIFLLIEGAKLLWDNWDKVTAIFSKSSKETMELTRNLEDQKATSDLLKSSIDSKISVMEAELGLMEAQGASGSKLLEKQKEINEEKRKSIALDVQTLDAGFQLHKHQLEAIKDNDSFLETLLKIEIQTLKNIGADETAAKEQKKLDALKLNDSKETLTALKKDEEELGALKDRLHILDIGQKIEEVKVHKSAADEHKKIEKSLSDSMSANLDEANKELDDNDKSRQEKYNQNQKDIADTRKKYEQLDISDTIKTGEAKVAISKKNAETEKKTAQDVANVKKKTEQDFFNGAVGLTDALFDFRINAEKEGSNAQTALKKQKFEIDKAFNASQAVIQGYLSVTGTLAATAELGPEISIPAGIAAGVAAAANVAKILAVQFEGGVQTATITPTLTPPTVGTRPEDSGTRATPGTAGTSNLQQIGAGLPGVSNGNTNSGSGQNVPTIIKAFVVSSDITSQQDKDKILKRRTHF